MIYEVTARLVPGLSTEFLGRLTDGSIASQKPDGREIVDSMQRARVDASGTVQWSETCYCATPLAHERATVYDRFFTELRIKEVGSHGTFAGEPLMEYLLNDA